MDIPLDDSALAALVSNVTVPMLGLPPFVVTKTHAQDELGHARIALIPIAGAPSLLVALSTDDVGGTALGAAMFACPQANVDASIMADTLGELVNMTAGQIKIALAKRDDALGLPKILPPSDHAVQAVRWRTVRLRSGGVELVLWLGRS